MGCISAALIKFHGRIARISPSWNDHHMLDGKVRKVKGDLGAAGDSPTR